MVEKIKCWKRLPQESSNRKTVWVNKDDGDVVRAMHLDDLKFFDVRDKDRFIRFEDGAKSKKDALAKANSYMRRNDRC